MVVNLILHTARCGDIDFDQPSLSGVALVPEAMRQLGHASAPVKPIASGTETIKLADGPSWRRASSSNPLPTPSRCAERETARSQT
jgi:hypothetical protein